MLVILCLTNLIANSGYSCIAPFYPIEAKLKGIDSSLFGLVFSSYSLAIFLGSPLYKVFLDNYHSKKLLIGGLICESISMLVFGELLWL